MITLPDITLTRDEQLILHHFVAALEPAKALAVQTRHPSWLLVVAIAITAERVLWEQNLKLVMHIAQPIAMRRQQDLDDLFQEGCLALRTAILRFDPALGNRFVTYAYHVISRHLQFAGTQSGYFADSRHFHLVRARMQRGERVPENTMRLASATRVDSDALLNHAADVDPFEAVDAANVDLLAPLTGAMREMVKLRFGFTGRVWSRRELAEHFQVSRSTISRWETEALRRLRAHVKEQQTAAIEATAAVVPVEDSISDRWRRRRRPLSLSALPSP